MRCLCGDSMLYDPEHGKRSFSAWARSHVERGFTLSTANRLANRLAHRRIPALSWLPEYSLSLLYADVMAGITVGVVLIPQGMAYAMLAELPPIYGLYSSLLPLPIYATLCTSRHMSIGPFALVSLLVAESVSEVVPTAHEGYVGAVMLLSLMIGLLHCLMAALNLGVIVRLISDSVLAGFTSAAAILISTSQLKHLLGIPIPRAPLLSTMWYILAHLPDVNPLALFVGVSGVALLHYLRRLNVLLCPRVHLPEQLILLLLATLISYVLDLEEVVHEAPTLSALQADLAPPVAPIVGDAANATAANATATPALALATRTAHRWLSLEVVGHVPAGLPRLVPPPFSSELALSLLKPAFVVGAFSFILSMSIARTFALQYEYATDSNQELYALGVANIVGAFFLSYPIAGSLSRSALVAETAQAHCTPMHGVVTACLVLLVLLLLTPAFRPMPRACLASIVFMAVRSLFDLRKPIELYRVKRADFVSWAAAFAATLLLGVQLGIGVGVLTSLTVIILRSARPRHATLGRLPRTNLYRDVRHYADAATTPGVVLFRFEASLHFVNKDYFASRLRRAIDQAVTPPAVSAVVVDFGCVNDVDASALRMLRDLLRELGHRSCSLLLCQCNPEVLELFEASRFVEAISRDRIFVGLPEAVQYAARIHAVRVGGGAGGGGGAAGGGVGESGGGGGVTDRGAAASPLATEMRRNGGSIATSTVGEGGAPPPVDGTRSASDRSSSSSAAAAVCGGGGSSSSELSRRPSPHFRSGSRTGIHVQLEALPTPAERQSSTSSAVDGRGGVGGSLTTPTADHEERFDQERSGEGGSGEGGSGEGGSGEENVGYGESGSEGESDEELVEGEATPQGRQPIPQQV